MSTSALGVRSSSAAAFLELTKPRITLMVVLTTLVGYVMASASEVPLPLLLRTLLGTGLVSGGASTLNMLLERASDARMLRTRSRPLPAGRLTPAAALTFGLVLTAAGLAVLGLGANLLAAAVALLTWASYLFVYTPLKPRTSLSTLVGAFPGALPPVIGWTAARDALDPSALLLFGILFLWQIPHTLAIAWIYRDDYGRARLPLLPVIDPDGRLTGRQMVAHSLALVLLSAAPAAAGLAGNTYLAGALVLGAAFAGTALRTAVRRTARAARLVFFASLAYLPALCALLLLDRTPRAPLLP